MSAYAIVKTGGKQYRVERGLTLLVERLPAGDGESVSLQPLLYVDGGDVVDGEDLARVSVEARVVAHERGPKLRIVKFKPKRGYKRRTGHRQNLTRIEVTSIGLSSGSASGSGGRGSRVPAAALGPAQRKTLNSLLGELGYPVVDEEWNGKASELRRGLCSEPVEQCEMCERVEKLVKRRVFAREMDVAGSELLLGSPFPRDIVGLELEDAINSCCNEWHIDLSNKRVARGLKGNSRVITSLATLEWLQSDEGNLGVALAHGDVRLWADGSLPEVGIMAARQVAGLLAGR